MKRILMTTDAVGGVWNYALQLSSLLATRGVRVLLAVVGPEPSAGQRADAARVRGLELHARPYALEWMPDPWADVDAAGDWLLALERRFQPDVVHINGFAHAALAWRAPVLLVAHSCVYSWWNAVHDAAPPAEWDEYKSRVTAGLGAASRIVTPSRAMRAALTRAYGVGHQAVVVANCHVDDERSVTAKQPLVFAAGRVWDPAKNIALLDRAAARLSWPVYVAGDTSGPGADSNRLSNVILLGRLSTFDTQQWMARAGIYALPARYEPFGLSVLEAARAGCALVLGDIPSLRENWEGAAIFVTPDRPEQLATALAALIEREGERDALAAAAQRRAGTFSPSRHVEQYLDLYRTLVATHGGPAHSTRTLRRDRPVARGTA
jgi:glycosyltransferase involved in cell wall biosynthesis